MKTIFLQLIKKYEDGKGYFLSFELDDNHPLYDNNCIFIGLEKLSNNKRSYFEFYYEVVARKVPYKLIQYNRFN